MVDVHNYCFWWWHRTLKCYFCIFKMLGVLWRLMQMLNLMLLQVAPALHITEENNALPLHCPDRWPILLQFQGRGQPLPLIIAHSQGKGLEQATVHALNLQVHCHNQELKKSLLNPMHHLQWQMGWVCDFRTIQSYFCVCQEILVFNNIIIITLIGSCSLGRTFSIF